MLTNAERIARARLVLERRGIAVEDMLAAEVSTSWSRCIETGLKPNAKPQNVALAESELRERRERSGHVRRLALAEMETLYQQIAGSNFLIAFADAEGAVLEAVADHQFGDSDSGRQIVPGTLWSEEIRGTNGLGTSIVAERPLIIHGPEHFFSCYSNVCCMAAPIRNAGGRIVGILDASSDCASRQRHTLALVQMAATHVENGLFAHEMSSHIVLAIHPRAEFLGTISAALVAMDGQGTISAVSSRGASIFAGLQVAPGASFEHLFNESFEKFLARLHGSDQTFLRDTLGSVHAVMWLNRGSANARGKRTFVAENAGLARPRSRLLREPSFVAEDRCVRDALALIAAAVRVNAPILIHGETGSGKEMFARYAHEVSGRRGEFVAINCAALPESLFEAELFGYAAGAFTGAHKNGSRGLIAAADGGTLLLDEVRELPLALQAALLRFLDDHSVRPVGGRSSFTADVQILAATNADLADEVAARRFRSDLLYRLDTVKAIVPPLRARSDFGPAVRFVLARIDPTATISEEAIARLEKHGWPGNFRELRAVLTRALLAANDMKIGIDEVAALLPSAPMESNELAGYALRGKVTGEVMQEFRRTGGNVSHTARNLSISRNTVYRYLREAGKHDPSGVPREDVAPGIP
ncbi:MAG TPA: sigma 54-interacting transcriptional regulator [Rhodocyclaceae bacterium]|nr:sigma 54-interacting transcriptional regulator [Rhodocyclaceae bacterium]